VEQAAARCLEDALPKEHSWPSPVRAASSRCAPLSRRGRLIPPSDPNPSSPALALVKALLLVERIGSAALCPPRA